MKQFLATLNIIIVGNYEINYNFIVFALSTTYMNKQDAWMGANKRKIL